MTQIKKFCAQDRNNLFSEAASSWNLIGIYQAIETVTSQPLSTLEKVILRGLLCEYSPRQIIAVCDQESEQLIINLVWQLYSYVEIIGNFPQQSIQNFQNIPLRLAALGFKKNNNTILLSSIDARVEEIFNGGRNISDLCLQDTKSEQIKKKYPPYNTSKN